MSLALSSPVTRPYAWPSEDTVFEVVGEKFEVELAILSCSKSPPTTSPSQLRYVSVSAASARLGRTISDDRNNLGALAIKACQLQKNWIERGVVKSSLKELAIYVESVDKKARCSSGCFRLPQRRRQLQFTAYWDGGFEPIRWRLLTVDGLCSGTTATGSMRLPNCHHSK